MDLERFLRVVQRKNEKEKYTERDRQKERERVRKTEKYTKRKRQSERANLVKKEIKRNKFISCQSHSFILYQN